MPAALTWLNSTRPSGAAGVTGAIDSVEPTTPVAPAAYGPTIADVVDLGAWPALSQTPAMAWSSLVKRDFSGRDGDLVPIKGWPTALKFDGQVTYLWWGQDIDNEDRAAARAGRLYTFASEADCWAMADAKGWAADGDPADQELVVATDLEPAQEWLRGRRMALDPKAGLNLWNWATDAAYSTGRPWSDRGGRRDDCYDKLFAANVPWAFGIESYRPRWNPRQLRTLRQVLSQAVHLLRAAMRG